MERIVGNGMCLRLVVPEDAEYIHGLRTDPSYNGHLSSVNGTVADQRAWIEAYKPREAAGEELYYVIEKADGTRCGVVRLYAITRESFTWGSWILDRNKPAKAALESAVLVYRIAFEKLGLERAGFDIRRENAHALAFHRRFGATETDRDDRNFYFEYRRDRFLQDYNTHLSVITG